MIQQQNFHFILIMNSKCYILIGCTMCNCLIFVTIFHDLSLFNKLVHFQFSLNFLPGFLVKYNSTKLVRGLLWNKSDFYIFFRNHMSDKTIFLFFFALNHYWLQNNIRPCLKTISKMRLAPDVKHYFFFPILHLMNCYLTNFTQEFACGAKIALRHF